MCVFFKYWGLTFLLQRSFFHILTNQTDMNERILGGIVLLRRDDHPRRHLGDFVGILFYFLDEKKKSACDSAVLYILLWQMFCRSAGVSKGSTAG